MKLPIVSGKEVHAVLLKHGFEVKRQKGSHVTLYKKTSQGKGLYVTVPLHSKPDLLPATLLSILRQAEITKEEFIQLLKS